MRSGRDQEFANVTLSALPPAPVWIVAEVERLRREQQARARCRSRDTRPCACRRARGDRRARRRPGRRAAGANVTCSGSVAPAASAAPERRLLDGDDARVRAAPCPRAGSSTGPAVRPGRRVAGARSRPRWAARSRFDAVRRVTRPGDGARSASRRRAASSVRVAPTATEPSFDRRRPGRAPLPRSRTRSAGRCGCRRRRALRQAVGTENFEAVPILPDHSSGSVPPEGHRLRRRAAGRRRRSGPFA